MKKMKLILLCLGLSLAGYSQETCISYTYDNAGNRTMRMLTVKSITPTNEKPEDEIAEEDSRSLDTEETKELESLRLKPNVYPNPTFGKVNIEVPEKLLTETKGESILLMVISPSGKTIIQQEITNANTLIDIADHAVGTYTLYLQYADKKESWQIIKQ